MVSKNNLEVGDEIVLSSFDRITNKFKIYGELDGVMLAKDSEGIVIRFNKKLLKQRYAVKIKAMTVGGYFTKDIEDFYLVEYTPEGLENTWREDYGNNEVIVVSCKLGEAGCGLLKSSVYRIPVEDAFGNKLNRQDISRFVKQFSIFAYSQKELKFYVTDILKNEGSFATSLLFRPLSDLQDNIIIPKSFFRGSELAAKISEVEKFVKGLQGDNQFSFFDRHPLFSGIENWEWIMYVWSKIKFIGADKGVMFESCWNKFHVGVDSSDQMKCFEAIYTFVNKIK